MKKEMACIICPMSCHIEVELNAENVIETVTGNTCKRGEQYARSELTNPVRMLTSTVILKNGLYKRLPVILSAEIPKDKILIVMDAINRAEVTAPVKIKEVIIENVCGLSVNVIASRSVKQVYAEAKP